MLPPLLYFLAVGPVVVCLYVCLFFKFKTPIPNATTHQALTEDGKMRRLSRRGLYAKPGFLLLYHYKTVRQSLPQHCSLYTLPTPLRELQASVAERCLRIEIITGEENLQEYKELTMGKKLGSFQFRCMPAI